MLLIDPNKNFLIQNYCEVENFQDQPWVKIEPFIFTWVSLNFHKKNVLDFFNFEAEPKFNLKVQMNN